MLLYGPPGTGKTEFARVLARSVRATAYEVSTERLDAEPLEGHKRFDAYRLSQVALEKKRRSVIVFDEIEDVFPDPALEFGRGRSRKAWVNRVLETNPTPAIWISNRIDQMDPAYLRRFDFVMQIDQPPREVRARILRDQLGQVPVRDEWLEGVASHQQLSPGLIATAAKVVALAGSEAEASNEERLERVVGNTLRAMGRPTTPTRVTKARVPYSQDFLNVDVDLSALIHGLKRRPEGRLCLYGLPGTGKTALVRHLSEVLQRPLISKSASDLLAPYVGQTEAQLAEMFEQARKDGAVLFLDEADSFLRDRREGATQLGGHAGERAARSDGALRWVVRLRDQPDGQRGSGGAPALRFQGPIRLHDGGAGPEAPGTSVRFECSGRGVRGWTSLIAPRFRAARAGGLRGCPASAGIAGSRADCAEGH